MLLGEVVKSRGLKCCWGEAVELRGEVVKSLLTACIVQTLELLKSRVFLIVL